LTLLNANFILWPVSEKHHFGLKKLKVPLPYSFLGWKGFLKKDLTVCAMF